jgi:ribosomal protein S2
MQQQIKKLNIFKPKNLCKVDKQNNKQYQINKKLKLRFNGIKKMKKLPDFLIIIGINTEIEAIREANKLKIPIIATIDTNTNPS